MITAIRIKCSLIFSYENKKFCKFCFISFHFDLIGGNCVDHSFLVFRHFEISSELHLFSNLKLFQESKRKYHHPRKLALVVQ